MLQEGSSIIGYLTTVGRVTGKLHTVALRLVYYHGRFYASRRDTASDWCRNLIKNPNVVLKLQGDDLPATARVVDDDRLAEKVSGLKYRDERASKRRVIVEIVPIRA